MTVDTFESLGLAARGPYHGVGGGGGLSTRDTTPYVWGFPSILVPVGGGPIVRTIVFWGPNRSSPV